VTDFKGNNAIEVTRTDHVVAKEIVDTADNLSKTYGQDDPTLTYEVLSGSLLVEDDFTGNLARVLGEDAGEYEITQDTLSLGDNYNIIFTSGVFTIEKEASQISIDPESLNKIYNGNPHEVIVN